MEDNAMKKQYEKPLMKVCELEHRTQLLTTSDPDYWGYAPGADSNINKLA